MDNTTEILNDSTAANFLTNSNESIKHAKHMDLKNHFVKQILAPRHAKTNYINSDKKKSDGLTKPLGLQKFETFREYLCVNVLQ